MNYIVQRGKIRGQGIKVPEGLPELLSDITREVLRCQPTEECLIQFVMDYLHSVLETREKAFVVKAVIDRSLQVVDEIIGDLCVCNIERKKAEELALVMEECFRNFLQKRRCERGRNKEMLKFGEDDILDELIRRCKFSVEELQKSMPFIENAYERFVDAYMNASDKAGGSEALYQYFKQRDDKRLMDNRRNLAAITIQKNWRGYLVRQVLDIHKRMKQCDEWKRAQEEAHENAIMNHAASIIQRFFKRIMNKCSPTQVSSETIMAEEEELSALKSELSLDPFNRQERGVLGKSEVAKIAETEKSESIEVVVHEDQEFLVVESAVQLETKQSQDGLPLDAGEMETPTEEVPSEPQPEQQPEPQPEAETSAEELQTVPTPEPEPENLQEVEPDPQPELETVGESIEAPVEEPMTTVEEDPETLEIAEDEIVVDNKEEDDIE